MEVSPPAKFVSQRDNDLFLPPHLSNAGKYAYCTLCTVAMQELFNDEWDEPFTQNCLEALHSHLQLPKSVKSVMQSLLRGEFSQSLEPCLEILKGEEVIQADCAILLQDFILMAVKDGTYDARWRVLALFVADQLSIPQDTVDEYEAAVVNCLTRARHEMSETETQAIENRQQKTKLKRYALVGLATLGGGALIGVTGGLAAPFIGAGIASLGLGGMVGGGAALLGTAAGAAVIGGLFGVAGAGLTGYKMNRRVGEIEEFAFECLNVQEADQDNNNKPSTSGECVQSHHLHIAIVISGWLRDEGIQEYVRPWGCIRSSQEQYILRYESRYLKELGRAFEYMLSMAVSVATQQTLKYTALSGLLSAIAWPGALLGLANIIDNPWSVCCRRASEVGKQLAEVLLAREQGLRPVTLVGFSIGARVIYYCLREMAGRSKCEGIIQDAILIGAPVSASPEDWQRFTQVVAGRLINGYCKSDWLLKFLYRTLSMPIHGIAGLHPIELDDRRMYNYDLSHIVSGHTDYSDKICPILRAMNVRVKNGPCGDVKMPKSRTTEDLPSSKADYSPLADIRRTQSANVLAFPKTPFEEDKCKNKDVNS